MREIFYSDELNDDFAKTNINTKDIPDDYEYIPKGRLRGIEAFILYRLIATPMATLFQKVVFGEKIIGRRKLKPYRRTGYFLYGNHTRMAGDAFTPSLVSFPKKAYIVTHADSVSIPMLGRIVADMGAMPLPQGIKGLLNFRAAVKERCERGDVTVIYPEAHIWPYYTKIRRFKSTSFRFPAENKKPVFTFTVTYKKRWLMNIPKTVVYVDGPFFCKEGEDVRCNAQYLCDTAYEVMKKRSEASSYEHVKYLKKGE
ncbi:MAG: hypothetical protein E7315_01525 [Clostridiales bacterium]|nr:hypothetical protein [Clostridiales bacterium]